MGMSCAVKGVLLIDRGHIEDLLVIQDQIQKGVQLSSNENLEYLFGFGIDGYVRSHFDENLGNNVVSDFNPETGLLSFISGFSAHNLESFIACVMPLCKGHLIYTVADSHSLNDDVAFYVKASNLMAEHYSAFKVFEIDMEHIGNDGCYEYVESSVGIRKDYDVKYEWRQSFT